MKSSIENYKAIVLPILFSLVGLWFYNFRILGDGFQFIPGDFGDSRFINYLLEHGYRFISDENSEFWNAPFMFPVSNTIGLSDHMILGVPLYAIFRLTGSDIESAFQYWWILVSILNFFSAYYFSNKLVKDPLLACIAAFLFAFGAFNLWHLNYVQMSMRFFVPPVIYYAIALVREPSSKHLSRYLIFILLQFLSVMYIGFFLFYFSFGLTVLYALFDKKVKHLVHFYLQKNLKQTLAVSILFITGIVLLMLPYLQSAQIVGLKLFGEVKWNIPTWKAYLFPNEASIWRGLSHITKPDVPNWWLQSTFTGFIPFIFLVLTPLLLLLDRLKRIELSSLQKVLAWTTLFITVLFIRLENGFTLYALIFKLPGMNSMRVLNRFVLVAFYIQLMFALTLLKNMKRGYIFLLIPLLLLDNWFDPARTLRSDKDEIQKRRLATEVLIGKIPADKKAFALCDSNETAFITHLDAMMASFQKDKPTINGYSSSCPDDFGPFFLNADEKNLNEWLKINSIDSSAVYVVERSK